MYVEVLFAPSLTFSSLIINYVTRHCFYVDKVQALEMKREMMLQEPRRPFF